MSHNGAMTDRRRATFEPALEALARAWNRLDPDLLAPWLMDRVRYVSIDTELSLQGSVQVLEYMRRKAARIEEVGEPARIRAELGWIPTLSGDPRPCVISGQGSVDRAALFMVTLTDSGLIERIEVSTTDPDPAFAEGTGILP